MDLVPPPKEIAFAQAEWDEIGAWGRAARILSAIYAAGGSKTELAERLGTSFNTINSWTMGDKDADWSRWISIATVLGVSETWQPSPDLLARAEHDLDEARPHLRSSPPRPVRRSAEKGKGR